MNKRNLRAGVVIVAATVIFVSVVLCSKASTKVDKANPETTAAQTVYIVYTNEQGDPYAVPYESTTYYRVYYPLTMDERETLAEIIAGKAGNKSQTCQRMVANVIFNDIMDCQGDLQWAVEKYDLDTPGTPNADTWEALDAIFFNGEYMLDEDVLWFNDVDHPSAFHGSLVYVCENAGIVFYKQHWPSVVPGGAE